MYLFDSTSNNPYRYVGQLGYYTHWMDPSLSDLLHLGVRFYEPGVGRFSQVDPAGEGWNWYVYVRNAPVQRIDPTGRKSGRSKDVCVACTGINPNRLRSGDYTYNPCQDCCTSLMAEPVLHNIAICAAAAGVPGPINFPETNIISGTLAKCEQDCEEVCARKESGAIAMRTYLECIFRKTLDDYIVGTIMRCLTHGCTRGCRI